MPSFVNRTDREPLALRRHRHLLSGKHARWRLPRRLVGELESEGLLVLHPFIYASFGGRESHERHRPLVYLAPRHKVTGQFRELYHTLVRQAA